MHNRKYGFTLIELLITATLLFTLALCGIPPLLQATSAMQVRLAAEEMVGVLRTAQAYALRHSTNVAVKFTTDENGAVTFALYRDGDGDGVLSQEIAAGVDPQLGPAQRLAHFSRRVRFGFPPGTPPRDPSDPRRRLDRLTDPIRFNRSDLASFSPLGGSTPGSVYITDGEKQLSVVRITEYTGRVRMLRYDGTTETWQ